MQISLETMVQFWSADARVADSNLEQMEQRKFSFVPFLTEGPSWEADIRS